MNNVPLFPKILKIFPKLANSFRIGKKKTSATRANYGGTKLKIKNYEKETIRYLSFPSRSAGPIHQAAVRQPPVCSFGHGRSLAA